MEQRGVEVRRISCAIRAGDAGAVADLGRMLDGGEAEAITQFEFEHAGACRHP